jgi:phage terminase large subunit GpA-like protein
MPKYIECNTYELFKNIFLCLKPPEDLTVSEWADKYRRLPAESSAEPGQWKTSKTPYLKKVMDCISNLSVRKVVMMFSAQIGKSETILNTMGYYAHIDPSPILMVQPTVDTGQNFSKERISPTIRDTDVLRRIIGEDKSRNSKNTILKKFFPGGYIAIVGANSPAGLASRPIKILLCDEIDRWPDSAKQEGDPLTIVEKRTTTYAYSYKMIYTSTPTIDGLSRIQHEFKQGTMEEWKLPCPLCGERHALQWANITYTANKDGELDEEKAILCKCPSCGGESNEAVWKSGQGLWFEQKTNKEIKSFHLNALASPWKPWVAIVKDYLASKDDLEMLKVWTNTDMGEPWVDEGETIEAADLLGRRKMYDGKIAEDVLVLTMGVDVQDDRFEYETVGWGEKKRSWGIEYGIVYGNTSLPETWKRLDDRIQKTFVTEDGATLGITRVCVDSGGHRTSECYRFCAERETRGVFAIKGKGGDGYNIIHSFTRTKKTRNALFIVAVDVAKAQLYSRLSLNDESKTGYCHFPLEAEAGYDEKYFEGLTSEVKVVKMVKGRPKTEWKVKTGVRNEPLDARVYAIAAIEILGPSYEALKRKRDGTPERKRRRGRKSKGIEVD